MRLSKLNIVMENLEAVEMWAKMGMSEKQIAGNLNISYSTFREYKKRYSALFDALCRGKEVADEAVENALYKRCLGYDAIETKATKVSEVYYDDRNNKCQRENVTTTEVIRHIPADPAAQKFWLINRKKEMWKDNPHKVENDKEILKLKKEIVEKENW